MNEVSGYDVRKDPRLINCMTECGNEQCYARRIGLFAEKTCPYYSEPRLPESPCPPPVAVKSAKWALCLRGKFACTNCGTRTKKRTNYCPNCGADMRAEEGERWTT